MPNPSDIRMGNRAVIKALTILEHLLVYKQGRSLSQLAEDLKLPVSSVNDVVRTLVKIGYLQHDSASRRYQLTLKLMDLGQSYLRQMALYTVSVPLLVQVSQRLGCVAAVYQFYRAACKLLLIKEEGGSPELHFGWQLGRAILHCSAPGKVVLASLTGDEVAEILSVVGMPQLTPHSITNLADLARDLEEVRKRGYALDHQESFLGMGCIAIPIVVDGSPIAALTVRMLIERLEPKFITSSLEVLSSTAAAIANGVTSTEFRNS
jgi:DNA-binding IclR family transcriptional regulator